jgi:hypothetical protein
MSNHLPPKTLVGYVKEIGKGIIERKEDMPDLQPIPTLS